MRHLTYAVVLALNLAAFAAEADTLVPLRAEDARASIGVNSHINYQDTTYARFPQVIEALQYLGVDQVRELSPSPWFAGSAPMAYYSELMRKGIHLTFIAQGGAVDLGKTVPQVSQLAAEAPGMIAAVEGFNEVDLAPVTWAGEAGPQAAVAAQKALFKAVRGDNHLKDVPVYDLTGVMPLPESLADRADFGNAHLYPQNGNPPDPWFKGMAELAAPNHLPMVVTEFGYASLPQSGWLVIGVGENEQAKGILSGIAAGWERGFARTYIYELFDQKPDPANSEREWHFGLFDVNLRKKPSAEALHNLTALLRDTDARAKSFTPRSLDIDLSALPKTAHHVVLEKADGTTLIVLWNEQVFWDRATGKPLSPPSVPVRLTLPPGAKVEALFDPTKGAAAMATYKMQTSVGFDLPDHPIILRVRR